MPPTCGHDMICQVAPCTGSTNSAYDREDTVQPMTMRQVDSELVPLRSPNGEANIGMTTSLGTHVAVYV